MRSQPGTNNNQSPVIIGTGEDIDRIAALAAGVGHNDTFEEMTFEPIPLSEASIHLPPAGHREHCHDDLSNGTAASPLGEFDSDEEALRASREIDARFRHSSTHSEELGDDLALPTPPERPSPIAGVVRPSGRVNRRIVVVALIVVALAVVLAFGIGKNNSAKNARPTDADAKAESKNDSPLRVTHPSDASLRSPESTYTAPTGDAAKAAEAEARYLGMTPAPSPSQPGTLPTTSISYTPASSAGSSAVRPADSASTIRPAPANQPSEGTVSYGSQGNYAVTMRAAQESVSAQVQRTAGQINATAQRGVEGAESAIGQKQADTKTSAIHLPPGTRIPMTLLEPLQSGIETTVEARIDADIRDSQGQLLLHTGQKVSIPFLPSHTNGRMLNAPSQIELPLPDGRTLSFAGAVKAQDGLVGLTGKITKTGNGTAVSKVFHGVTRVGMQAGQTMLGRSGVNAGEIGLDDSVADRYGAYGQRAPREVVNVPAGIHFHFVVAK